MSDSNGYRSSGSGSGGRNRTIDLNSDDQIVERRAAHTLVRDVYRTRGGLQVGCTFVTGDAMEELVKIWQEGKAS